MISTTSPIKMFLMALAMLSVASVHAAAGPVAPKGNHYILAEPGMTALMPVCMKLQQSVNNFLIKQRTLHNLGLSRGFGYTYEDADFNILKPHISLLPVPSTHPVPALANQAQIAMAHYHAGKIPTTFTFKKIKAFLPHPNSKKIFIVARISSTVHFGFKNLSQYLEQSLGITNPHPWFLGHITLGILKTTKASGFTQQNVNTLNSTLANFRTIQLPKGQYNINAIILSPYQQNKTIQLWP